jgi:hypothetical protein
MGIVCVLNSRRAAGVCKKLDSRREMGFMYALNSCRAAEYWIVSSWRLSSSSVVSIKGWTLVVQSGSCMCSTLVALWGMVWLVVGDSRRPVKMVMMMEMMEIVEDCWMVCVVMAVVFGEVFREHS